MRFLASLALVVTLTACANPGATGYQLVKTVPVAGDGGWDYVKIDKDARRVYVTHSTQVDVLDADSGKPVGVIGGLQGVHGIALSPELGRGFITNGLSDTVTIFDLKTLEVLGEVETGRKPDAIASDDLTHRALAMNGEGESATIIDEVESKKIGTIALGGHPEFAVPDDQGHIFVNLEDTNKTLVLDVAEGKVVERWSVSPGKSPSSLALDRAHHRLFIGCRNRILVVMDSDSGDVVTSLAIGDHVDATMYDPVAHNIISSNGDGTLTVIKQDDANHYHVARTIVTHEGSRTFGLDAKRHRLFVPAADFTPAPEPTADNPKPRPQVVPGSFKVLIFAP